MLAMTTDSSRRISYDCNTAVPLRIHELFRPYIRSILEENYNYPNSLISVLAKLPSLNPLSELIPLQKSMKGKNDYTNLIREYF